MNVSRQTHLLLLFFLHILLVSSVASKIPDESVQNVVLEATTQLAEVLEATMEERRIERSPCFHIDVNDFCLNKTTVSEKPSCECELYRDSIVCCNVTDIARSLACLNASSFRNVHIVNAMQSEVNLTSLNSVKQVDSLAITNGNVSRIVGQFSKFTSIKCLNFSSNNITEVSERALLNLSQLKVLDLSTNNITKLPTIQNITVNIQGNSKVSCFNISAILDKVTFLNKEKSYCESEVSGWFNDKAAITIDHIEKRNKLDLECPEECKCKPGNMHYRNIDEKDQNDVLIFIAEVDCSNQGLTRLPHKLPENTLQLNITNNSIASLSELVTNDHYQNIQSLYADDNLITSIVDLEGTKFLENFTILSLRNNKIKDIPYYILSNLEKNLNGKYLYLGGNRLTCECHIIKNIRHWRLINDCDKILCNNMQAKILELKESQLCKSGIDDWANYIEYVIVLEVILLVALFTKVSYDYYVFKRTGFLPYPASFIILYNQK